MRLHVETRLDCPADHAFQAVQSSALLGEICAGWCRFEPVGDETVPATWAAGGHFRLKPYIFGVLPSGVHEFKVVRIDHAAREMHFSEHDAVVSRWEHLIRVRPAAAGCIYSDTIDLDAGLLTPVVFLWSKAFYTARQRRLRRLLPSAPRPSSPRP
jgi:hypothetical protein